MRHGLPPVNRSDTDLPFRLLPSDSVTNNRPQNRNRSPGRQSALLRRSNTIKATAPHGVSAKSKSLAKPIPSVKITLDTLPEYEIIAEKTGHLDTLPRYELIHERPGSLQPTGKHKSSIQRKTVGFNIVMDDADDGTIESEFRNFQNSGSVRHKEARLSLLGRPLTYRHHKRGASYRWTQARIYNYLERPKEYTSVLYHLLVFLMVFMCLVFSVLATIPEYEKRITRGLFFLENVMVVWFMSEYLLRVWSAGCRSRYQGLHGRKKFMMRPSCILDGVIILASVVVLSVGSSGQVFATSALRGLRFFQILRMMRMDRRGGTWKLLGSVVWAHRQELLTTLYIGFLGLIFSSFMVFMVEKEVNGKFNTYADALWWGVITLCTVGYGDAVPITWGGKIIAAFCALLGVSFFALPAGILGSGFALKVQQQQRHKHLIRRRVPAAVVIQCLWRCYAADEHSRSVATWKRHLKPCPSPIPEAVPAKSSWRPQTSFVSRFSTRRKDRSHSQVSAMGCHRNRLSSMQSTNESSEVHEHLMRKDHGSTKKENSSSTKDSEDDTEPILNKLTEQHKYAIRALRKISFFVARRKFREALRPYDVKDVMEQYTSGHLDMLSRVKILQTRLDQILGKVGSKGKDVYESKQSLASRVVNVERQVEDIDTKLDDFLEMYKEDRRSMLLVYQHLQAQLESQAQSPQIDVHYPTSDDSPTSTPNLRHPLKPMQRNYSDLGTRVKKRVTYLSLGDVSSRLPQHTLLSETSALLSENCDTPTYVDIKEECQSDHTANSSDSPKSDHFVVTLQDSDTDELTTELTPLTPQDSLSEDIADEIEDHFTSDFPSEHVVDDSISRKESASSCFTFPIMYSEPTETSPCKYISTSPLTAVTHHELPCVSSGNSHSLPPVNTCTENPLYTSSQHCLPAPFNSHRSRADSVHTPTTPSPSTCPDIAKQLRRFSHGHLPIAETNRNRHASHPHDIYTKQNIHNELSDKKHKGVATLVPIPQRINLTTPITIPLYSSAGSRNLSDTIPLQDIPVMSHDPYVPYTISTISTDDRLSPTNVESTPTAVQKPGISYIDLNKSDDVQTYTRLCGNNKILPNSRISGDVRRTKSCPERKRTPHSPVADNELLFHNNIDHIKDWTSCDSPLTFQPTSDTQTLFADGERASGLTSESSPLLDSQIFVYPSPRIRTSSSSSVSSDNVCTKGENS